MKHYKAAVFGATVMSAGIAEILQKDAIIIEKSESVATDYASCINTRLAKITDTKTEQTAAFRRELEKRNLISAEGKIHVFPLSGICSLYLQKSTVLLATEIISVSKTADGFLIRLFNIDGFTEITADNIIDTTPLGIGEAYCPTLEYQKRLNAVIVGSNPPESEYLVKGRFEGEYVFSVPFERTIPLSTALNSLCELWEEKVRAEFKGFRLASIAPSFAYSFKEHVCRKITDRYLHVPSAACENTGAAFEEGILYASELS